ncbi:MAG: hypothetical protein JSV04_14095 [Candidatus Heimdallarchaeota archaeon]|nr:MAG: hypothetical protein JSV04_14095 [Candidatus Heimdallarchaeota archaeon]
MNIIEIVQSNLENYYILIIMILLFIALRSINSYWPKKMNDLVSYDFFEKGNTEYSEPPRPSSNSYKKFLRLASMKTKNQQKTLTQTLSHLLNDLFQMKGQKKIQECSKNLNLLLTDPERWYHYHSSLITESMSFRKVKASKVFLLLFTQILDEVQELLGISLYTDME